MFHPRFLGYGLFLLIFSSCLSLPQEAFAVPVQYTNLNYMPNMKSTVQHLGLEGNLNSLMQAQNAINGFPDYFNESALGQMVNKGMSTIDSIESTVTETIDAGIGSATTIAGAAVDKASGAVSGAVDTAAGAVGDAVDQGMDYAGDLAKQGYDYVSDAVSSTGIGEKAGAGFASIKSSGSAVIDKLNELNPFKNLTNRNKDEKFCDNLTTTDGVKECFYINPDDEPGLLEVGERHEHVAKGQYTGISNLYADSAAIINATANFEDVEEDVNDENPKTVSETLTKRTESDLAFNVIGGAYLGSDLSTLELNALSIYSTINTIKSGGGF